MYMKDCYFFRHLSPLEIKVKSTCQGSYRGLTIERKPLFHLATPTSTQIEYYSSKLSNLVAMHVIFWCNHTQR